MNKNGFYLFLCLSILVIFYSISLQLLNEPFHIIDNNDNLIEKEYKNEPKKPIVVLYSCLNRYWDKTIDNHIKIIKKTTNNDINNVLIGIHYWNDLSAQIPEQIKNMKFKSSTSENIFDEDKTIQNINIRNGKLVLKRFIHSTKIALENAEKLYREIYNTEMPMEQQIIRFRYDVYIDDVDKFPFPLIDEDNYYLSNWNTEHRSYDKNKKEIADAVFFTTKKALLNIINVDMDTFIKDNYIIEINTNELVYHEHILYLLLKKIGIKIIFDFNLKLYLVRDNNDRYKLS